MKFGFDLPSGSVSEEKMFEHCGRTDDDDGRRSMGILKAHL